MIKKIEDMGWREQLDTYNQDSAKKNGELFEAYFEGFGGNHHTDYIGMSEDMLEIIADRLMVNFAETKKLDLSFFGTEKQKWLEQLVLGYNPWNDGRTVVTEILSQKLWTMILNKIKEKEYLITGFDLEGVNESFYDTAPMGIKEHVGKKWIKVRKNPNGISFFSLKLLGNVHERTLESHPIKFVEFSLQSEGYNFTDINHTIEKEFNQKQVLRSTDTV
jgi:hypothetical protein